MIRLTDYYGNDCWVAPARVLSVHDGGCGSRGVSTTIVFDNGKTVSVLGWAADIVKQLEKSKT